MPETRSHEYMNISRRYFFSTLFHCSKKGKHSQQYFISMHHADEVDKIQRERKETPMQLLITMNTLYSFVLCLQQVVYSSAAAAAVIIINIIIKRRILMKMTEVCSFILYWTSNWVFVSICSLRLDDSQTNASGIKNMNLIQLSSQPSTA